MNLELSQPDLPSHSTRHQSCSAMHPVTVTICLSGTVSMTRWSVPGPVRMFTWVVVKKFAPSARAPLAANARPTDRMAADRTTLATSLKVIGLMAVSFRSLLSVSGVSKRQRPTGESVPSPGTGRPTRASSRPNANRRRMAAPVRFSCVEKISRSDRAGRPSPCPRCTCGRCPRPSSWSRIPRRSRPRTSRPRPRPGPIPRREWWSASSWCR